MFRAVFPAVRQAKPAHDLRRACPLNVYERSKLHTDKTVFCRLGTMMPDKVRFFVWWRNGKAVAFCDCMVHGDTMFAEYLGLDYSVALKLQLYHYIFRNLVRWAIASGYKGIQNGALNYDPKLHFRHRLDPIDLYVKHTSIIINAIMRLALPLLEPTRHNTLNAAREVWTVAREEHAAAKA
jgi:Acetyltransferase (GNAT) domain